MMRRVVSGSCAEFTFLCEVSLLVTGSGPFRRSAGDVDHLVELQYIDINNSTIFRWQFRSRIILGALTRK